MSKKNYNSIDLWKFIFAFTVVSIHTHPLENVNNITIQKVFSIFASMAVPFFFLASGYLIAIKMNLGYEDCNWGRIKKTTSKIFKMYMVWNLVYLPLTIYHFISTSTPLPKAILLYFRGLLLIGEQYNSWPLWYLLSTIYSLIIIYLYLKRWKSTESLIVLSVISSIIYSGATSFVNYEGTYSTAFETARKLIIWSFGNGRIVSGLVYIPLGMLLSRKKIPTVINYTLLISSGIIVYYVENELVSELLTIILSIGFFGAVNCVSLSDNPVYERLRAHSTVIYLVHMYIWSLYYKTVYGQKTYGLDSFLVTSAISFILAYSYYQLSKRERILFFASTE